MSNFLRLCDAIPLNRGVAIDFDSIQPIPFERSRTNQYIDEQRTRQMQQQQLVETVNELLEGYRTCNVRYPELTKSLEELEIETKVGIIHLPRNGNQFVIDIEFGVVLSNKTTTHLQMYTTQFREANSAMRVLDTALISGKLSESLQFNTRQLLTLLTGHYFMSGEKRIMWFVAESEYMNMDAISDEKQNACLDHLFNQFPELKPYDKRKFDMVNDVWANPIPAKVHIEFKRKYGDVVTVYKLGKGGE